MEIILVILGLSIQSEIVTKVDAAMGRMLKSEEKVVIPSPQFMRIKIIGHKISDAHFLSLRFMKTSSLNIPTKFGIIPANAPRQK